MSKTQNNPEHLVEPLTDSAKVFLMNEAGQAYVPRRSARETSRVGEGDWFGGGMLKAELPIDALVREVWEEAGLILALDIDYLRFLGVHNKVRDTYTKHSYMFGGVILGQTPVLPADGEHDQIWTPSHIGEYSRIPMSRKLKNWGLNYWDTVDNMRRSLVGLPLIEVVPIQTV